jgi:hypothetical protein
MENFHQHMQELNAHNQLYEKEKSDKAFKKFENFYFHLKDVKDQQKIKKQKHKDRMVNKKEKLEEMEEATLNKKESIMKKLNDLDTRRSQVFEKRAETYSKLILREQENYNKLLTNKNKLHGSKAEINQFVLAYQSDRFGKANLKEHSVNLNRLNAQYNI